MSPEISDIINYSILGTTIAFLTLAIILVSSLSGVAIETGNFKFVMLYLLKLAIEFA